jgi:colicin import membrane protein
MGLDTNGFDVSINSVERKMKNFQSSMSRMGLARLGPFAAIAASIASVKSVMDKVREDEAFAVQNQSLSRMVNTLDYLGLTVEKTWEGVGKVIGKIISTGVTGLIRITSLGKESGTSLMSSISASLQLGREIEATSAAMRRNGEELEKIEKSINDILRERQDLLDSQMTSSDQYLKAERERKKIEKELSDTRRALNVMATYDPRTLNDETRNRILEQTLKAKELERDLQKAINKELRLKIASERDYQSQLKEIEAERKKAADEQARKDKEYAERMKREAEALARAQERTAELEKEASREQMGINERIADMQKEINKLRELGNKETVDGNEAIQKSIELEKRMNSEIKAKADRIREITRELKRQSEQQRDIEAKIREAKIPGYQFTLTDAAEGRRGSRSNQRAARQVLKLEEQNREDIDTWRWYMEQGRTREAEQLASRIRDRRSRISAARRGISGLRDEERDPVAALNLIKKELVEQTEIAKQQLEEVRKL